MPGPPAGDFLLIPGRMAVRAAGQRMDLSPTQFRILAFLMAEPGRTFSRAELVRIAIQDVVEERTVDVHVKELRRKLGPYGTRIETVRGAGYRYQPPPASPPVAPDPAV